MSERVEQGIRYTNNQHTHEKSLNDIINHWEKVIQKKYIISVKIPTSKHIEKNRYL